MRKHVGGNTNRNARIFEILLTDEELNASGNSGSGIFTVPEWEKMRENPEFNIADRERPTTKAKLNLNFSLVEFFNHYRKQNGKRVEPATSLLYIK